MAAIDYGVLVIKDGILLNPDEWSYDFKLQLDDGVVLRVGRNSVSVDTFNFDNYFKELSELKEINPVDSTTVWRKINSNLNEVLYIDYFYRYFDGEKAEKNEKRGNYDFSFKDYIKGSLHFFGCNHIRLEFSFKGSHYVVLSGEGIDSPEKTRSYYYAYRNKENNSFFNVVDRFLDKYYYSVRKTNV